MRRNKHRQVLAEEGSMKIQLSDLGDQDSPSKSARSSSSPTKKKQKKQELSAQEKRSLYRRFFKYSLRRWKFGLFCIVVAVASGIVASLFPWKLGKLLDIVTKQTDNNISQQQFRQTLLNSMLQLTLLTLLIAVLTFLRSISLRLYQQKLSIDLRTQIYTIFMHNDINFFQIYKTGQLISRLSNDINQAKSAISNNLTFLLRNLMQIVASIFILFMMSWNLTLIVLSTVPVYWVVTVQYTRKSKELIRRKQDLEAEISVHVGEKFGGIQTIKAYSAQKQEIDRYVQANMETYQVIKTRSIYQAFHATVSNFLPSFGALMVLLFSGAQLLNNNIQLSAGQLTSFILYCNNLTTTTAGISNSYTNIINGTGAIQKVFQMMNYQRLVVQDVGRNIQINGDVRFQNVGFQYPMAEAPIFRGVTFGIRKGEYVAFVGQSGSGKSTVTKLIEHFYRVQSGDIFFGQQNSNQINIKHVRQQIGLVSQQAAIFSGTIQQNITYGLKDYSLLDMQKAAQKAGCLDFLNNKNQFPHGYQTIVGQRGVNLSGGQRQRISIARALMRKPKILIFDQATSALDANSQDLVRRSIEELANGTITIIVVAHRLSSVINCDRLYVMKEGRIVETGTHKQLIKNKGYYYTLILKQLHSTEIQNQKSTEQGESVTPTKKQKQKKPCYAQSQSQNQSERSATTKEQKEQTLRIRRRKNSKTGDS